MDEKAKKEVLLMIPYGLFVLGAAHGSIATAATVNWVTQASFAPPLVVVGIKKDSGSHALVKESKVFALSILEAGQKSIAGFFFRHVEPKDGKFGDIAFELGASPRTIEIHRSRMMSKMRAGSLQELVRLAIAAKSSAQT